MPETAVPRNPVTPVLEEAARLLQALQWDSAHALSSCISAIPLVFVLVVGGVVWPYGLFYVPLVILSRQVTETRHQLGEAREGSLAEAIPVVVSLGFYVLMWAVFAVVCLPLLVIAAIFAALSRLDPR